MDQNIQLIQVCSNDEILIQCSDLFLSSDGFYPPFIKMKSQLQIENMIFHIFPVQFDNDDIQKLNQQEYIQYSQDIVIQLAKSNKFICVIVHNDKYILSLTNNIDRTTLFRIQPCYKSQIQNSNKVSFDDDIFLMYSPENITLQTLEQQSDLFVNVNENVKQTSDFIISTTKQTTFQLKKHLKDNQSTSFCYGSLIKIKQIERDSYLELTTNENIQQNPQNNNLHMTDVQTQYQRIYSKNKTIFWRSGERNQQNIDLLIYDIWRLYHPQKINQQIKQGDQFYLQNLSGNFYLNGDQICQNYQEASLFSLIEEESINNKLFYILWNNQYLSYKIINENNFNQIQDKQLVEYKSKKSKLDLLQFDLISNVDFVHQNWLDNIVHLIYQINLKYQLHYDDINSFIKNQSINDGKFDELFFELQQLEIVLNDLTIFCVADEEKPKIIDKNAIYYLKMNQYNQDLLRKKVIVQSLIEFIEIVKWSYDYTQIIEQNKIESNNDIPIQEHNIQFLFQLNTILNQTFLFFEAFSSNNDYNSQIIFLAYFKLKQYLGYNVGAFYCLIRLFENNSNLIPVAGIMPFIGESEKEFDLSLIKRSTRINTILTKQQNQTKSQTLIDEIFERANYCLQILNKRFWGNIMKILSVLCLQNDKACFNNQINIGKHIIKGPKILLQIFIKEDNLIYVQIDDKLYELNEIYVQNSKANKDFMKDIIECKNFLDSQLNLIGLLCQERNYENIQFYRTKLPQKTLINYISYSGNAESLRCRLIIILMNLYVDCYPYQPKQIPKLIFNLNKLYGSVQQSNGFNAEASSLELQEFQKQSFHKQLTRQFTINDTKAIEKLLTITQELVKLNLIQQNQINLSLSVCKILQMFYKLYTFNLPQNKEFHEKYFDVNLLIQAYTLLPQSLEQNQPLQEQVQQFQQFQEQKEIFNQMSIILIDFLQLYFKQKETKILTSIIKTSQQFDYLDFSQQYNYSRYEKIKENTFLLLKHKQSQTETQLKAFNLTESLYQPKRNIIKRLQKCLFLENQEEVLKYQFIKSMILQLKELESADEKQQLYQNCINSLINLNQLLKKAENLLLLQKILRILNVDFILLDFLESYQQICQVITQKFNKSNNDNRYILEINNEEESILQFCTQSFIILKYQCNGNNYNKQRILSKFNQFDEFLKCIDLGQYDLLQEIYSESYENIESASSRIIYLLLDNLNFGSLKVLESLVIQQNISSSKNLFEIIQQIQNSKKLKQQLGFQDNPLDKILSQNKFQTFQKQFLIGNMPYTFQIQGIQFVLYLLKYSNPQGCKVLADSFPLQQVIKYCTQLKDIFKPKFEDLNLAILNTILKTQLIKLFNVLLNYKEIIKYDDEIQQTIVLFIDKETKVFESKVVVLDPKMKSTNEAQKIYDYIDSNFKFKIQKQQKENQQLFQQIQSGSENDSDDSDSKEDEQLSECQKQMACFSLQHNFNCLYFNDYAMLLLNVFLNLAQLIQEQIENFEESKSKPGSRASSTLARQMSLSQAFAESIANDMNQSVKLKPFHNLKVKIDLFLKQIEEYLKANLTKWEIIENGHFLIEKSQQLKILFLRKLEFQNCNLDQIEQQKKDQVVDPYCSPIYCNDNRIHELNLLKNKSENKFIDKQINSFFINEQILAIENFDMYFQIYKQQLFMNEDFEIISENFSKPIVPLINCFSSSMNNLNKNFKSAKKILKFLWHMLDIHTYIRDDYIQTVKVYELNKKGKYHSKSEQILQIKAIKAFQNLLVNQGFFEIFLQFCNSYDKIKIVQQSELFLLNKKKKEKLLYQFLLTSIRLVRGIESANQFAQQKLMQEILKTKSNYMLKIFTSIFERYQQQDETLKLRSLIQHDINRVYLAYEFNENHRLEQKKNAMKLGILQVQMKLIQLLAEDHYRPFQDFFREQIGFAQNYDIIQHLMNILLNFFNQESFYALSQDDYILILNCFDCLKENIQGPCPQNQEKLCQPQFLRLCGKLLGFDDSQIKFLNLYQRFSKIDQALLNQDKERSRLQTQEQVRKINNLQDKTIIQQQIIQYYIQCPIYCKQLVTSFRKSNSLNYKLFMLSEIKYRCATTLESLTDNEQNESDILKRISMIINEKILIRNITIQYEKYKILHGSGKNYTNLVFSHLLGEDAKNIEQEKERKKNIQRRKVQIKDSNTYWYQVEQEVTVESAVKDFWDSFIIETGFSLFNLLAQVYQMKDQDVLERIYEQIDNTKTQKKKYKSIVFYNLYKAIFQASQLTKNIRQLQQSAQLSDKIFNPYKLKKASGEQEAQQKKLGYRALRFFATRTGSIEILLPSKQLKKVMFPLVPHCFALNNVIKEKFASDIDRLSQQRKVESVLSNSSHIIQKLKTEYKFQALYKKNFVINLLASNQKLWKQIIFLVIVLENLMILFSSDSNLEKIFGDILFGLTITQIILQFLCFFIFIVKKLPYLRIKSQEIVFEKQINRIRMREIKYKYLDNSQSIVLQEDFVLEKTDSFLLEQNKWRRLYFNITDYLTLYKCILLDYEMIYFLIFTTLAFIGLYVNIVLALLLLDVFWRFPTLTSIVNAIWRPSGSILLVLSLYIIMQYYYSLIVYHYYADQYTPYCENLLQCFSFILDVTFKTDGGSVGFVSSSDVYADENYRYSILNFWEFVYVFVVISLLYSIITGIIIDSFGVLRDEAEELDNDIKGFCLICGIDRGTLEKKAKHKKGFRFHVKYEHCVWNYIFYISYLEDKKKSDYNGIESYVDSDLKRESINWFPINKSLSIPDEEEEQEELSNFKQTIDDRLIEIYNKIDQLKG
uniref:Calcium-release channel VI-2b n=1 Tax=Paramecium tetraurelia TaxID=5888 RepID=G7ZUA5_PARTE|nr:TPA: calcium-release channel VI-2b [Paramecium tetraurelia]